MRLGVEGVTVADGYDPMMFARSVKTPVELDLIRRATRLNEAAIRKTVGAWQKGATWRDLNIAYARSVAELGGFVRDPGGMVWGHPRGTDADHHAGHRASRTARWRPARTSCSTATAPSTSTAGTAARPGWWRASREGDAKRWAKATSAVAETLIAAMKPGARIRDLQALARSTYRSAGVPDPDRAIVFFHGLGLSHMELELMTSDGTARDSSWVLEEGMVAPIHLLYPGGQFDRSWCEEVVEIRSDGGRPLFSWGFDPITGT